MINKRIVRMLKYFILFLSLICLLGCITPDPTPNPTPDPEDLDTEVVQFQEFAPYVKNFLIEGKKYHTKILKDQLNNLKISFSEINLYDSTTGEQLSGYCYPYQTPKKIVISKPYWIQYTEITKEVIIFHELGHCLLSREHIPALDKHGHALSIMDHNPNEVISTEYYYKKHRDEYMKELFTLIDTKGNLL